MRDFEHAKRQILERIDIVQLVSDYVTLRRNGRRWVGLCCFHSEKTPSFMVDPDRGTFKCFGCGKGGDVFSFLEEKEGVPFIEAMKLLADRAGVELRFDRQGEAEHVSGQPSRRDLANVCAWAGDFFHRNLLHESLGRVAREYLVGRGLKSDSWKKFGIGLASTLGPSLTHAARAAGFAVPVLVAADLLRETQDGRVFETFRDRLMFPIRDPLNRTLGFGGRTLIGDPAKYLNTRQTALFDKGKLLYGLDQAKSAMAEKKRAIVVEGYTDCIAVHQAGIGETVATLGTALGTSQIDALRRYADEVILLFDSDDAGAAAAERALHLALPRCMKVRLARVPDGKDPCDFLSIGTGEQFRDVLNRAVDALEFVWSLTLDRYGASGSNAAKRSAILDFLGVVANACTGGVMDPIQKGLVVNQVAHLLRMDASEVRALLAKSKTRPEASDSKTASLETQKKNVRAESSAWDRLLSATLNHPPLAARLGELLEELTLCGEQDRRLCGIISELFDKRGEFGFTDVLAVCQNRLDAERLEELARVGAERGNHEATFELAHERIKAAYRVRMMEQAKQRIREKSAPSISTGPLEQEFSAIRDGAAAHRHFAPRRLVTRAILTADGDRIENADGAAKPMENR